MPLPSDWCLCLVLASWAGKPACRSRGAHCPNSHQPFEGSGGNPKLRSMLANAALSDRGRCLCLQICAALWEWNFNHDTFITHLGDWCKKGLNERADKYW